MKNRPVLLILVLLGLCLPLPGNALVSSQPPQQQPPQPSLSISTSEQFADEFKAVPCKDGERLQMVRQLLARMGAAETDIVVDAHKNVENLVIRKPGAGSEKIIVGAHYDKAEEGCGAIDNWSGIVALAHLYKTFRDFPLQKSVVFVAFGKEEKGLIGSRAMATAIPKEQISQYCLMINLDSFGLGRPQVVDNISSPKVIEAITQISQRMKLPFAHTSIFTANGDSSPFLQRKIPAVSLHGLAGSPFEIIHSEKDVATRVNPESVYLGYRLALALLYEADTNKCDAFR